jgi:ribosomal protein S27AE
LTISADHTHDFTHRRVTAFLPLKRGRRRHQTTTYGCCVCGASQPMAEHLDREVLEFLGRAAYDLKEVTR